MDIEIRRAEECDIPRMVDLLYQVYKVHADKRPDLFRGSGESAKKYDEGELKEIIADEERPVFTALIDGRVEGYAFCVFQRNAGYDTLYIDDLCVDEKKRGEHIGKALYEHVLEFARKSGCYNVTLNVWEGNDGAIKFYRKMGLSTLKTTMEQVL